MYDCQEVFSEFLSLALLRLIKNDETCPCSLENPFDKVDAESGESIPVGHHNFLDQAFLCVLQKPREPFALVAEPRGDVFVDLGVWLLRLERLHLAFEVVFLFAGDLAVDSTL